MKKISKILVALLLCLSLTACGGKTEPEVEDKDVLKIVVLSDLNSDYGTRAKFIMDHMVEEKNAAGGVVDGRQVVVEFLDCGTDQQSYIDCMQKAVNVEGVDCILGFYYGNWAIAASDIVADAKIPTINLACNKIQLNMNDYYFINRAVTTGVNDSWAYMAIEGGIKNPVMIAQNVDNSIVTSNQVAAIYEKEGLTFNTDNIIWYDLGNTTDWNPIVLKAMQQEGDGIMIIGTTGDDGQQLFSLLHKAGYDKPISVVSSMMDKFIPSTIGAECCEGIFGIAEYAEDLDTAGNKAYIAKLNEWGWFDTYESTGWADAVYYDDFLLFCAAAEKAGDTTPQAIYDGLEAIENVEGALTTYSAHIDHSLANDVYKAVYLADGSIELQGTVEVVHSPLDR